MSYKLQIAVSDVTNEKQFVNADGNTECVEFVRQAAGAPTTTLWTKGDNVMESKQGAILPGTVIATFDAKGNYPRDTKGRHAAVYLGHTSKGIRVLDQWKMQGRVRERMIYLARPLFPRVDCAAQFYVVE